MSSAFRRYYQDCIDRWSQPHLGLEKGFIPLTLLLDQREEIQGLRWAPQGHQFQDLGEVLAAVRDPVLMLFGPRHSGKTTLLRHFELNNARAALATGADEYLVHGAVTFFIDLQGYRMGGGAPPRPHDWLNEMWAAQYPELPSLDALLLEGCVTLLLDDFDAILQADSELLKHWEAFLAQLPQRYPGNRVIFSCYLDYSDMLSSRGLPVHQVRIEPFSNPQEAFIREDSIQGEARAFLANSDYRGAVDTFRRLEERDPELKSRIHSEFGFLFRLMNHKESGRIALEWCKRLWTIVAQGNTGVLPKSGSFVQIEETGIAISEVASEKDKAQGQKYTGLDGATIRFLQCLFTLSSELEANLRGALRDSPPGSPIVWDLAFDAMRKGFPAVRCHVECTARNELITSGDLAPKWHRAAEAPNPPDYWILIGPRANPDRDLLGFLQSERARSRYGFGIQVWGPGMGVDELLGLEPELFDRFFPPPADGPHPRDWSDERRNQILARFSGLLKPVLSLPEGWETYVNQPEHLCFSENERCDFEPTYPGRVPVRLIKEGTELSGSAEQRLIDDWLGNPDAPRCCLLLGEFGDGKSFLTYTLGRELLQRFHEAPDKGIVPLRLALRDYHSHTTPREFLQDHLERFGTDTKGWADIKRRFRTLVILDGFDEISKELDPQTVSRNIADLLKCCEATVFDGCKLLITSRMHFFESSDADRLLKRLKHPVVYRLARIPRQQVRAGLRRGLEAPEQHALLERIETMHDPIGLASKPLFYQMVKATLHELPQDPDEVVIYDCYVRQGLSRKLELLDDPELRTDPELNLEHMLSLMGRLAEELQCSDKPYVSLKALAGLPGLELARLLWDLSTGDPEPSGTGSSQQESNSRDLIRDGLEKQMENLRENYNAAINDLGICRSEVDRTRLKRQIKSIEEEIKDLEGQLAEPSPGAPPSSLDQDALARVGTRSLLTRIESSDVSDPWLVDFCHRSMREYFVARRLVDHFEQGPDSVVAWFQRVPVNYEILFFAGRILRRRDTDLAIKLLLGVLERSTLESDPHGFGGRALTLLASLSPKLPGDFSYRGRNYSLADLEDADLSGLDFSGSRFQGANLSNADLSRANLSGCDLSGVRLHETTAVCAIASAPPGERILGAYEDGSVWEWDLTPGGRPDYRILFSEQGLRISRLGCAPGRVVWAAAERQLLLLDTFADPWECMARIPLAQRISDFTAGGSILSVLGIDGGSACQVVDLDAMAVTLEARMPETPVFAAADRGLLVHRADDTRLRLVAGDRYAGLACEIPCKEATSVAIRAVAEDEALVGLGQADGQVLLVRVRPGQPTGSAEEIFAWPVHKEGPVTNLLFLDAETLVSGGGDRVIAVTHVPGRAGAAPAVQPIKRSLRCAGLCIDGIVPEPQRQRLARMIEQAESGPSLP